MRTNHTGQPQSYPDQHSQRHPYVPPWALTRNSSACPCPRSRGCSTTGAFRHCARFVAWRTNAPPALTRVDTNVAQASLASGMPCQIGAEYHYGVHDGPPGVFCGLNDVELLTYHIPLTPLGDAKYSTGWWYRDEREGS